MEVTLTKPVFERLVEHLVYIEENIDEIVDLYYPETNDERENVRAYLLHYVGKIEKVLEKIRVVQHISKGASKRKKPEELNRFPFVIIGSTVVLEDIYGKERIKYRIVYPFEHTSVYDISCLSTTARELLLSDAGSQVIIGAPGGRKRYRIISISLE